MPFLSIFYVIAGVAALMCALLDSRELVRSHYIPLLFSIFGDGVIGTALIALALDHLTADHFFLLTFPAGLCLLFFCYKYRAEARRRVNTAR